MKALKSLLIISFVLLFSLSFCLEAKAEVTAPKITKLTGAENFIVSGTAPIESEVLIYLDGNFAGQAETRASVKPAELDFNFQYREKRKLADGTHTVMAVAKDKTSLVLSAPSNEVKFTINSLPAPILIAPDEKTVTAKTKPLIIGLVRSGSAVKIFIDDIYDGKTEILKHGSNTANFSYRPFLNLSRGWHKVYAIAENGEGEASRMSEVLRFNIELPLPAPTVFKPVVNEKTSSRRPFIVGLAKNDSRIKIYIDKKLNGEFRVKNHPSGAASFAYKPAKPLTRGNHLVYAIAEDKRGKQSDWSKVIYFPVRDSQIAQSVQEQKNNAAVRIEESKKTVKPDFSVPIISGSSGAIEKEQDNKFNNQDQADSLEKVKNLAGDNAAGKATSGQGMINESNLNQGKLRLSLALFILFLVGVVAWLLWVNRELVKERRAHDKSEDEKNKPDSMSGGQDNKL